MAANVPSTADVVIVGGGIVGCSIAYHLARLGVKDIVLLERRQITCGTTWHAAGLASELRDSRPLTELSRYTMQLWSELEQETGQQTGFKRVGSVSVALNEGRFEELKRRASMARGFGVEAEVIGVDDIAKRCPYLSTHDMVGGVWMPNDGQTKCSFGWWVVTVSMKTLPRFNNFVLARLLSLRACGRITYCAH